MSPFRHRFTRRDSERLLDEPAAHGGALGNALDAARAPARTHELVREDATVAQFHAARLSTTPISRSNFVSPSTLGRRAATRAVIATGAVVGLGISGVALAAAGHLPTLPDQASDQATESVAKQVPPTPSAEETSQSAAETEADEPSAAPSPSLEGLCKAFQAGDKATQGKSLESAAFAALVTAAGSAEDVATYCVDLVGEPKESARPEDAGRPDDAGRPTETGQPTETGRPEDAGQPTVLPTPTEKPGNTDRPTTDGPATGKPEAPGAAVTPEAR